MSSAHAQPLVVLSDVHLGYGGSNAPGLDLARLIRAHAGHEIILAGDVFDLSVDPPTRDPKASIVELLRHHRSAFEALRSHLASGARLGFLAGNHDAAVAGRGVTKALLDALQLNDTAPLETNPWFVRRGGVHIEHGHLYDPDNAPAHPLALWSHHTEPLGIALTRRFLAPSRALDFAHAHETTPLGGLIRTFELFGWRAPLVVAQYFATATKLCLEAGHQEGLANERELGAERMSDFARETGLLPEILDQLADARPNPTHHRFSDTFMRLYFDRIIATLAFATGMSSMLLQRSLTGAAITALSGAYLGRSVKTNRSRYTGITEQRLRKAAEGIAEATQADLVIFGHTHREEEGPRYLNSGSFAYSRQHGRPYILIEPGGQAERRYLTRTSTA